MASTSVRSARFPLLRCMSLFVSISILVVVLVSTSTHAASGPKSVAGYIYDESGQKVQGATVTVNMKDSGGTIRHTEVYSPTGASGLYLVTFAPADWDEGNTIEVIATKGSDQGTNTTTADGTNSQLVDVHFVTAIPQLGSLFGLFVTAGIVGTVAVVFLRTRRRE